MKAATSRNISEYRDGYRGFMGWLDDFQPRILSRGKYVAFKPNRWQRRVLKAVFKRKHRTLCISAPRRYGKSLLCALILLHRFMTRPHQNMVIASCSLDQTLAIGFTLLRQIIINSPRIREIVGAENIGKSSIKYPGLQNEITGLATSEPSAFGRGIDCVWVSEIGQAVNDSIYHVLASSTGDRPDPIVLLDSTTGPPSNIFRHLYDLAVSGQDPSIFFHHEQWRPGEPVPDHVDPAWLRSREKQMLPSEFQRFHMNSWVAGGSSLFTLEDIRNSIVPEIRLDDLRQRYKQLYIGVGADLAQAYSKRGDGSWITTCAKGIGGKLDVTPADWVSVGPNSPRKFEYREQTDYFVLRCTSVPLDADRKRELEDIREYLGTFPDAALFEAFQADSLYQWALGKGIPAELVHPSRNNQLEAFNEYHNAVSQGRFKMTAEHNVLRGEMESFQIDMSTSVPTFGGAFKNKAKGPSDDSCYAAAWAIHSLKDRNEHNTTETIRI